STLVLSFSVADRDPRSFPTRRSSDLYVWLEAARSFNQALRLDPKLAMAHLGLTIAYSELNAAAAAHAALDRARALAATDHDRTRSEEHTSELQSRVDLLRRLLLEKKQ